MITDIHKDDYGTKGTVRWELFDIEIEVNIEDGVNIEYAEKCAEALNSLPDNIIKEIFEAAKRYCLYFIDFCGEEWEEWNEMGIDVTEETPAKTLESEVSFTSVIVDKPKDDRIGFCIGGSCTWDDEHGLEIAILDEKLVYLGAFEGRGAWSDFKPDDEWNFVNVLGK